MRVMPLKAPLFAWIIATAAVDEALPPDSPYLSEFSVTARLPSNVKRLIPFQPAFHSTASGSHFNHHCMLDYAMTSFTLNLESQFPAILSSITQNGNNVPSRTNLTSIHLAPGEKTIFSITVGDRSTRDYTLIVQRRTGNSLQLLGLRPITAKLDIPFHPGELQEHFDMVQTFYEDFFEIEYIKGDGGQQVECQVDNSEITSDNVPTRGDLYRNPNNYVPAIERLHSPEQKEHYDNAQGDMVSCRLPIDTWRRLTISLRITSANSMEKRFVRLVVSREGCKRDTYFHRGRCNAFCPMNYFMQKFNWRCGACGANCEFCDNWNHCVRCRSDTTLVRYKQQDDGTCASVRIHKYRVYYDLARYFGMACAALLALYMVVCLAWTSRKLCCDHQEPRTRSLVGGFEGGRNAKRRPFNNRGRGLGDSDEDIDVE